MVNVWGFYASIENSVVVVLFSEGLGDAGSSGLLTLRYHRDKELNKTFCE